MIIDEITLDLSQKTKIPCIYAKQGDDATRFVRVTLTDNGEMYDCAGQEVIFRARKPDLTMIYNPATVNDDGTITLELTQQTLAAAGTVFADVCLCGDEGQILSSAPFWIHVDVMPQGSLQDSANEWLAMQNRLNSLELGFATDEQVNSAVVAYLKNNPAIRGENGATFTPEVSVDGVLSWTNDGGQENPQSVDIVQMVVDALGGAPVFGVVDEKNTITLTSMLSDGTYVLKYEDNEGNVTEIGTVTVGQGEEETVANLFSADLATLNSRWSNSSYGYVTGNGYVVSDYIAVSVPSDAASPSILRWRGGEMAGNAGLIYYSASKTVLAASDASSNGAGLNSSNESFTTDDNGDGMVYLGFKNGELQSNWKQSAAFIRLCLQINTTSAEITVDDIKDIIVTIDQPIG